MPTHIVVGVVHGTWDPKSAIPYAKVPARTELYTFMKELNTMWAVEADRAALLGTDGLDVLAEEGELHKEFSHVKNLSTSALGPGERALVPPVLLNGKTAANVELVSQAGLTIQQIMDNYPGKKIFWFACEAVSLSPIEFRDLSRDPGVDPHMHPDINIEEDPDNRIIDVGGGMVIADQDTYGAGRTNQPHSFAAAIHRATQADLNTAMVDGYNHIFGE